MLAPGYLTGQAVNQFIVHGQADQEFSQVNHAFHSNKRGPA